MSSALTVSDLQKKNIPDHVAIIMDGNGRWAERNKRPRVWGHKKGVESVREAVRTAAELGVKVLSLYAFSEENWGRPQSEVNVIIGLIDTFIVKERTELQRNNVMLRTMGDISRLPQKTRTLIEETVEFLAGNTGLVLNIALSYGAKSELARACRLIGAKLLEGELSLDDIDVQLVEDHLWTKGLPLPDLLIRTSGEQRISNFMLWQIAYSELWFTSVAWPEFRREHFLTAVATYQERQRRFGLLS